MGGQGCGRGEGSGKTEGGTEGLRAGQPTGCAHSTAGRRAASKRTTEQCGNEIWLAAAEEGVAGSTRQRVRCKVRRGRLWGGLHKA